jgi:hypothetical protein
LILALTEPQVYDPHSIIQERPGPITKDSLAAESVRTGGAFSRNADSEPLDVEGPKSTFTNTDTSGATRLDPASDAEARMAQNDWAEEKKLSSGVSASGAHGGPATSAQGSRQTGESTSDTVRDHDGRQYRRAGGPKGTNLQEGGFESEDLKNASFDSDIGTEDDPGRAAELTFETVNADNYTAIPRQREISGDTRYNPLESETSA